MNPFQYITANSPEEAIELVGQNGRFLGGGIDLLGEMKDYIVSPDVLVNVKAISDALIQPSEKDGASASPSYSLAANVTMAQIAEHKGLRKVLPGIVEAAREIGSPQIRNVATLAGNLLQHSRCWYYRQPDITCLKRGGSTCYAQEGENKYSALWSGCACISPIISNLATVFAALDAQVSVQEGPNQKARLYSIKELYETAWTNPAAHHSLKPEDFLSSVTVPLKRQQSAYRQVSEKSEFDWALVSCAAAGTIINGHITDARVALGAVAPVPYMVAEAHDFLEGKPLNEKTVSKAADLILKDAKPLEHNGYKVPLAHTLIRRTLLALNP